MSMCLPEELKIVDGSATIATTNGGITCDYISLKNASRVTVVAKLLQAVSHTTALGYNTCTVVAGTNATAGLVAQKIWKNADVSSSDTLVAGTDATTVSATAGATNQILVMQIDPATLPEGSPVICATLSDSSQATDFADVTYYIETKFPQATPPATITD